MVGFETLYLVLAGETVQRLTPSARQALPPLGRVDLRRGARTSSCTVRALLGAAEADIANLATLEIGDVLRLEQRVDKPLRVIDDSWRVICGAALGQCAGHLAVSLMKAPELEMTP
jgi:flagellar motor switch protein FliM